MKSNWKSSPQHPETIAYVPYGEGYLIRIEYNLKNKCWDISILNGVVTFERERTIHQMAEVKVLAENGLVATIKDIKRTFEIE